MRWPPPPGRPAGRTRGAAGWAATCRASRRPPAGQRCRCTPLNRTGPGTAPSVRPPPRGHRSRRPAAPSDSPGPGGTATPRPARGARRPRTPRAIPSAPRPRRRGAPPASHPAAPLPGTLRGLSPGGPVGTWLPGAPRRPGRSPPRRRRGRRARVSSWPKLWAAPAAAAARLQTVPMRAIARTRLHRSTSSAAGKAPSPTVTDTTDTSAPSCASDNAHSSCSAGNVATTTCRSAKSRTISANAAANTTLGRETSVRSTSSDWCAAVACPHGSPPRPPVTEVE